MSKTISLLPRARHTQQLLDSSWQRQTCIDEPRLSEIAQTYRELGYEVRVVMEAADQPAPVQQVPQAEPGCRVCLTAAVAGPRPVGTVFIRARASAGQALLDDLFA